MRGRRRAAQEQAILSAWWTVRIKADAQDGAGKSLGDYLDELLSDEERHDRSAVQLAAFFDGQIEAGAATVQ